MNREDVLCRLHSLAESDYKEFNKRITPTEKDVLGVRLPALRSLAKEICKGDWRGFLQSAEDDIFEEQMLQGLVVAYAKIDDETRMEYIDGFVPKIENWAVCDCFCGTLKSVGKNPNGYFDFLQKYLQREDEFQLRFAAVMLMDYYINDQYIDRVLKIYDVIKSDKYYVRMAVAWGISVCFVKYREKTMAFLQNNSLDDLTYNKTLQKITESLRVDKETKAVIKSMKRKN